MHSGFISDLPRRSSTCAADTAKINFEERTSVTEDKHISFVYGHYKFHAFGCIAYVLFLFVRLFSRGRTLRFCGFRLRFFYLFNSNIFRLGSSNVCR